MDLETILTTFVHEQDRKPKPVFFVDLCCVTNDEAVIETVVHNAMVARMAGWYIVLAYSSGGGLMNDRSSLRMTTVCNELESLDGYSCSLESTVFNDREADKFIDEFHVDIERLKKDGIQVANNPYLLSIFTNTKSNSSKFDSSIDSFWFKIRELAKTFISTLQNEVYKSAFNDCLVLLECARHNAALNPTQLAEYRQSYLHIERLMMLEGDKVKLLFPPMYNLIVKRLKDKYVRHDEQVLQLPIVQGYMFENRFLQCKDLHRLSVSAVMEEAGDPHTFIFPSLVSASQQESGPINLLMENQICHLRPSHPAIDGVCVAVDSIGVKYLLLLQVSLSEYRQHVSKGIDIKRPVDQNFEGKVLSGKTIAEYYKHYAGVKEDKNVIYVYVSPKEVKPPSDITFCQALKRHETRSHQSIPQYLYGFCMDSDKLIERLSQQ